MGLYVKFHRHRSSNEVAMLEAFKELVQKFALFFKFDRDSPFVLTRDFEEHPPVYTGEKFKQSGLLELIKRDRSKYQEVTKDPIHYSISVEGMISLQNEGGDLDSMVVDINGTCDPTKDLYGNLWVNFYNSNQAWPEYFVGEDSYQEQNRETMYKLINAIKVPEFHIKSIYFAKENYVLDLLEDAYYLHWDKYKNFVQEMASMIKERINLKNLEYNQIYLTKDLQNLLKQMRRNFDLYNPGAIVNITQKNTQYLEQYQKYLDKIYKGNVVCSTASFEIKDKYMSPRAIRNAVIDYLSNYLMSLNKGLISYKKMEDSLNTTFSAHSFSSSGKEAPQTKMGKYTKE